MGYSRRDDADAESTYTNEILDYSNILPSNAMAVTPPSSLFLLARSTVRSLSRVHVQVFSHLATGLESHSFVWFSRVASRIGLLLGSRVRFAMREGGGARRARRARRRLAGFLQPVWN